MTSEYYVYILLDSSKPGDYKYGDYRFEYEPFYVGKGKSDRVKNTFYDKSPFKSRKIKKLRDSGIDILTEKVHLDIKSSDALDKEILLINLIGRRDLGKGPLVNLTDGGDGRLNSKHTKEVKDKISKNRKGKGIGWHHDKKTLEIMSSKQSGDGNGFYGKSHTDEVKELNSDRVSGQSHPMYGKKHNDLTIEKLIKHRRDNVSNDKIKESCQKFNKSVLMYDLNLNFISEFSSVKEASLDTGINESIISKCCRGDIKSPTRFYFRFKNQEDNIKNNKYLISIGDKFIINNKVFSLFDRNKKTCICESNSKMETLHIKNYPILFDKETNNINLVELFLFLKSIDNSFKLKDNIVYNKKINIKFLKLLDNSEVFNVNIYDDDSDVVIFEDEWNLKKDIVKSRLMNFLTKSNKIGARKCQIVEVTDNKLVSEFLDKNHLQGFVRSKIKIGLFFDGELVSLMTFGSLRKNLGLSSKDNNYELLRFCNKIGFNVTGGASRLFKFFLSIFKPDYVLSYSDNRWGSGGVYGTLGFKKVGKTPPNYCYIVDGVRKNRFNFRKDILVGMGYDEEKTEVEIMNSLGNYRIFDKGSSKFEFIDI